MAYLKYKRRVRRGRGRPLKKAVGVAAKARVRTRVAKMANVEALAKSMSRMKREMRRQMEVKEYTPAAQSILNIGQVDINASGSDGQVLDICTIQTGNGATQRIGNKVKCIGIHFRFQITQMSSAFMSSNLIFDVYRTADFAPSFTNVRNLLYDPDSISNVIDSNSSRNQDAIKSKSNPSGAYELIASRKVYMRSDSFSGDLGIFKDFKLFVKQNCEFNYNSNLAIAPDNYRYILVIRSQTGNRNTTTQSTLSVPATATSTGFTVRFTHTCYYIDP